MDEREFEEALDRVADSAKKELTEPQIGELGIGIFAFNQVGQTCTFYSKKAKGTPTVKVILKSNSDEYEIETARKSEARIAPGMTIVITRLHHDPTKARGSLNPTSLKKSFAEKFDSYLRQKNLEITIKSDGAEFKVAPLEISLIKVGEDFKEWHLKGDWQKKFKCEFWFDPTGKSTLSIRHTGVSIIEDVKDHSAFTAEENVYTRGYLKGYIDADFLEPMPSRTSFEENQDWLQFLAELDGIRPSLEDEIEELRQEEEKKELTQIQRRAVELAREILNQDEFKDLELLKGLRKKRGPVTHKGKTHPKGRSTGNDSEPIKKGRLGGLRITPLEQPFAEGASKHSEFLSKAGVVRINTRNDDYKRECKGSLTDRLAYTILLIGKESIAYNDESKSADYYLEKLISYLFQVKTKASREPLKKRKPKQKRQTHPPASKRLI